MSDDRSTNPGPDDADLIRRLSREERRLRLRRRGRRAYIRSVYFLPSLCTLGNAVCGFAAMYVAAWWGMHGFSVAAYLMLERLGASLGDLGDE